MQAVQKCQSQRNYYNNNNNNTKRHTQDIQKGKTGKNISSMRAKSKVVICQKHVD